MPTFLIDNTNPHLITKFPKSLSLKDVGLDSNSSDNDIFDKAIDYDAIIVTRNAKHFIDINRNGYYRSGHKACGGGRGLLIVNEKTAFDYNKVTRQLRINGQKITWDDVMRWNLKVSVNNGEPDVQQLPNCQRCIAEEFENKKFRKRFNELGLLKILR